MTIGALPREAAGFTRSPQFLQDFTNPLSRGKAMIESWFIQSPFYTFYLFRQVFLDGAQQFPWTTSEMILSNKHLVSQVNRSCNCLTKQLIMLDYFNTLPH